MGLNYSYMPGQTPLDVDELDGLRIPTIATRSELDEFEQHNIEEAIQWQMSRSFRSETILTEDFVCNLHKRMYGNVWSWAGQFRRTDKNIGVDKWQIPVALRCLLDDTAFQIANTVYHPEEVSIRFKHRIVSIHCFPNGNGRHSRLMADIMIEKIFRLPVFSWGAIRLTGQGEARDTYLRALKSADAGDIMPLLVFARS